MHYILDGYNLLFRLIKNREDLEKSRKNFIFDIEKKAALLNLDITLVFDGRFQSEERSRTHYKNLEIIYSSHGETADELILSELAACENKRGEIVVTSDRDLSIRARKLKAKTETAEEFFLWLNARYKKRQKKKPPSFPKKNISQPSALPVFNPQDELQDYYLKEFQKRLPKEEKPLKKKKSRQEQDIDDFKRWKKIFEERLQENDPQ